jgi:hypothetical protein
MIKRNIVFLMRFEFIKKEKQFEDTGRTKAKLPQQSWISEAEDRRIIWPYEFRCEILKEYPTRGVPFVFVFVSCIFLELLWENHFTVGLPIFCPSPFKCSFCFSL